jgi:hypothetical protein
MGDRQLDADAILTVLRRRLASYKLPKCILMFGEADLEFTGNQKIQGGKLVQRALARLRDEARVIEGVNYRDYLVDTAS